MKDIAASSLGSWIDRCPVVDIPKFFELILYYWIFKLLHMICY